jgi:HSP20 family molecular chaperone IbpA
MAMQPRIIQSMHDQVRAIYRALTGEDVAESDASPETTEETDEDITRRFAELEALARVLPSVMERVPPFTFTPPVDIIAAADTVIVELALPGVDREEITAELRPSALVIGGIRRDPADRGEVFHAEIPRGPFLRTIPLPFPIEGEPRIELDRGVLRIYLPLAATTAREGAAGNSKSGVKPEQTEQRSTGT